MEYSVGTTGRIIAARLFEGEDIYESVETIARAEDIKSAAVLITGGFREANVVVGPKQEEPKIVGNFRDFAGPGEVLGVGTIYCDEKGRSCTSTPQSEKATKQWSAVPAAEQKPSSLWKLL